MNDIPSWIYDDITWCVDECPHTDCERHLSNRINPDALYSGAFFKGTETCPHYPSSDIPSNTENRE